MKNKKHILFLFAFVLFVSCQQTPEMDITIHSCAPMPEGGRACATCFVYDGQAYFFAGRDQSEKYHNDLWCYNPQDDSWTHLGATPLTPRVNATACVQGNKVYIGLGFCGKYSRDTSYLCDWWEYTPTTQEWKRLADYPNLYTDCATSFVGDGELYVGYGFCWNYRRDMFRYNIAQNQWDSIDVNVSFHGYPTRSFGGTGCTCAGRHFMGTGYYKQSLNWWAEFMPEGYWVERAAVPGKTRTIAASTASSKYIYLCGGMHYGGMNTHGNVLQDILRYEPNGDTWQYIAIMPKRLMNHNCFTIDNTIYLGLGENEDLEINDQLYYFAE